MSHTKPLWKRVLAAPFLALTAIILIFEDWLWEPMKQAGAWVAVHLPVKWLEDRIRQLKPAYAAATFLVPMVISIALKFLAVFIFAAGFHVIGVLFVLLVKFGGTFFCSRLFMLTRDQLLKIIVLGYLYTDIIAFRTRMYVRIHAWPIYQRTRAVLRWTRIRSKLFWARLKFA